MNISKLLFFSLLALTLSCSTKKKKHEVKPVPVKVTTSITKDVPLYLKTVGHMEAYNTVHIMAQANGRLMRTYFNDGDDISEGDLLFLIDQRPYLASLKKAEGALEESIANMMYAKRTAERNTPLVKDEYISINTYDKLVTSVEADEGVVKQTEASFDTAEINLSYTTIYSPINAKAGERLIDDGNLILEDIETKLVTLNQITPIYATFFIGEKDLPNIQHFQEKNGELLTVISSENPHHPPYEGLLTFIDNEVDLATGMIKLKATLGNQEKTLWPNQYIEVKLILETLLDAVLIPFKAVQTNSKGKYVYTLKHDGTVELRQIKLGQRQESNLIVVTEGLSGHECVVTEGQLSLHHGSKVKVVEDESL